MANKKNNNKNLMNNITGTSHMIKGSLSGLDDVNNEVEEKETSLDSTNNQNATAVEEDKQENEKKEKRSFMLTNEQIEMIYKLKIKFKGKAYGVIVGEAIEDFYKKHYESNT